MRKVIKEAGEIGLFVREQRKSRHISQMDFSENIGSTQATICRTETGIKSPRLDTLIKMLSGLGCTLVIEWEDEE